MNEAAVHQERDFLGRLIDRALGRADAVDPKMPSLFEPPETFGAPLDSTIQEETIDEEVAAPQRRQSRPGQEPKTLTERMIKPDTSYIGNDEHAVAHRPVTMERFETSVNSRLTSADEVTAAARTIHRASPQASSYPSSEEGLREANSFPLQNVRSKDRRIVQTVTDSEPQITQQTLTPDQGARQHPTLARESQQTGPKRRAEIEGEISAAIGPRVSTVITMTSLRPSPTPAREPQQTDGPGRSIEIDGDISAAMVPRVSAAVAMPSLRFLPQTVPKNSTAAPEPKPEPTINVTIGRIEVRATPPPIQQPSEQRSAPRVMTLEEYLRQRSQGGQR
jgi:hypothetical protein